ncbi:MAG TPA: hypothetical protein VLE97_05880 [Gaiellaceae bacterium]|nr:hypothetical protein [Gaiellaceae bacterium]
MLDLARLFPEAKMFDSRRSWRKRGFEIVNDDDEREIMVAAHPGAPGLLFKKFTNKVKASDQLANYRLRAEGAAELRKFIAAERLKRVIVPQKWVRELPAVRKTHVLVVERVDVLTRRETRKAYPNLDGATLRELCVVVREFRGLDSGARNMLLTRSGQIAFVDTERWKRETDRAYLRHVEDYLTKDQRALAKKIFKQLDA